jgi:hypothetical protein
VQNIHSTWQQLVVWREASPYRIGQHQWLEELITPPDGPWDKAQFDLYMPIRQETPRALHSVHKRSGDLMELST